LDFVKDESRESLLGKESSIRIGVPVRKTECDGVLDRGGIIYLGPDILGERSSSSHVEALAAQAEAQDRQVGSLLEERLETIVLVSAQEMENK
jgi:hypothetical protein